MPTGYTYGVQEGKITKFTDFTLKCARAFGACVEMREESLDVPIPEAFKIDTSYHDRGIASAKNDLADAKSWTGNQANQKAKDAYEGALVDYEKSKATNALYKQRYEAMLLKVRNWKISGRYFSGLKKFMIQQLQESIRFDCYTRTKPKMVSGEKFKQNAIERAQWSLAYHRQERKKEIKRGRQRNAWIQKLRANLAEIKE